MYEKKVADFQLEINFSFFVVGKHKTWFMDYSIQLVPFIAVQHHINTPDKCLKFHLLLIISFFPCEVMWPSDDLLFTGEVYRRVYMYWKTCK